MNNPFDRDIQNLPLLHFLIHSDSFSNDILTERSPASHLIKLNELEEIQIIPLPVANDAIREKLTSYGLVCTEYSSYESGVALKALNGSIYNVITYIKNQPPPKLWEKVVAGTSVVLADVFASNIGDYLAVSSSDPILEVKIANNNIISVEKALELVRILLTAHGRFYIQPKVKVNEGFYYLYRFKKLFKAYQNAWTVATYAHGKGLPEKVFDYLDSLGTRLEFICRAYDKIAFFSMKSANNDTQRNQLYHLAYYVMLITGIFDDLAHIIKDFYQLKINDRWDVGLRIPQNKKTTNFYKKLIACNANLHSYLTSSDVQNKIHAFYPMRDSLQHRELSKGIHYAENFEDVGNLFELSNEATQMLLMASIPSDCIVHVHKSCLNPLPFISWAHKVIIDVVNETLSRIDWESACQKLPMDIQNKISESDHLFKEGVGKFLGWPTEPLYF